MMEKYDRKGSLVDKPNESQFCLNTSLHDIQCEIKL